MKLKNSETMTNSTSLQSEKSRAAAGVVNIIGLIAGALIAAASLATLSPIGFFGGLAGALFCLDGMRQSW